MIHLCAMNHQKISFIGCVCIYVYVLFIVTAAMLDYWQNHPTQLGKQTSKDELGHFWFKLAQRFQRRRCLKKFMIPDAKWSQKLIWSYRPFRWDKEPNTWIHALPSSWQFVYIWFVVYKQWMPTRVVVEVSINTNLQTYHNVHGQRTIYSINILYICAKTKETKWVRHKLYKLMKSFPILQYKLQFVLTR
jgi:hypothetical protein